MLIDSAAELEQFKKEVTRELKIKDALIAKLTDRNAGLEVLMKKAVKIMQNPVVMRDAFKKFNFHKVVYTTDEKNKVEILASEEDPELTTKGKNRANSMNSNSLVRAVNDTEEDEGPTSALSA